MDLNKRNYLSLLSFLLIPVLFLWNPSWISLMGVQPYWPLFWLLPWSIINGSLIGCLTGLIIGIILDSINNDLYTQIPGLILCGIWFGKLGNYKKNFFTKFKYGLSCSVGSLLCGLIYFSQIIYSNYVYKNFFSLSFGIRNIFSQVFLTGLLAPIFCSLLFTFFNKNRKRNT